MHFVLHAQIGNAVVFCNSFLKFLTTRSESESARNYNNDQARGSYETETSKKIQAGRDANSRRKSKWKLFLTAQLKQSRFSKTKITRKKLSTEQSFTKNPTNSSLRGYSPLRGFKAGIPSSRSWGDFSWLFTLSCSLSTSTDMQQGARRGRRLRRCC